jgi:hypothetical protein
MKYLITIILSVLALTANAQHRHHHGHHGHGHHGHSNGWGWVAPALIGGAIVYGATRPSTPPPPVVYQQSPLPPPPYGYRYEQILDANCNCYRWVLVQG